MHIEARSVLTLKQRAVVVCKQAGAHVDIAIAGVAHAQSYPSRPIKVITPFPAAQGPDVLPRSVAEKVGAALDQSVIVENKPGGSGFIAFRAERPREEGVLLPRAGRDGIARDYPYHLGIVSTPPMQLPLQASNTWRRTADNRKPQ